MTALLTLVTGVVLYVMDVQRVATHFIHLTDVCLLCLGDCLMLLGLLMLIFETVLPLTVKVMVCTSRTTTQTQNLHCYCICSCLAFWTVTPLTLS